MRIVPIFAPYLYSFQFGSYPHDEFKRVFREWNDIVYLEDFFENNLQNLKQYPYGSHPTVEGAAFDTIDYAEELETKIHQAIQNVKLGKSSDLDSLFELLDDRKANYTVIDETKAKKKWLRLYAIRVAKNKYIITGGAIKLTHKMNQGINTKNELTVLKYCHKFLNDNGIIDNSTGNIQMFKIV
jgi:hypothetical protein